MSLFEKRIRKNLWNPMFLWGWIVAGMEIRRHKKRRAACEKYGHESIVPVVSTQTAASSTIVYGTLTYTCACTRCGEPVRV